MLLHFINFLILTLSLLSTQSFGSPVQLLPSSQLEVRAGPSGYLNHPFGGETYDNYDGFGKISISYAQVRYAS